MSLKLNKLSDTRIRERIGENREMLEQFLTADPSSPMRSDPIRYSEELSDTALQLGLELYQQEDSAAEIQRSFALAGSQLFSVLSLSQEKAVLSPLEFEKALALAVCFCPHSVYESVDKIPMEKFFADPKSLEFFAVLARYLDVLSDFIGTGKLNQAAWRRVEAECTRSNAPRYDAQVNLAKLKALRAVDQGDEALLNDAIRTLIEDHENEAKRGENQRSSRGFICLPALLFAHLGAARGLRCTVVSPYLPLQLLS
jgi:Immunity protein 49